MQTEAKDLFPPRRRRTAVTIMLGGYSQVALVTVSGIVLVPLYFHYIGAELYGAWVGSGDVVAWLSIIDMGLASLMIQRMADAYGEGSFKKIASYFSAGLLAQIVLVSLLMLGANIVSNQVPQWMSIEGNRASKLSDAFMLATFAASLMILNNGVTGLALALQRTVFFNVVAILGVLIKFGATLFLLVAGYGLISIPAGMVISNGVVLTANAMYAAFLLTKEVRSSLVPTIEVFREIATLSPAIFFAKLGNTLMGRTEAAMVAILLSPEQAAIFSVTRRAADIIQLLLDRFGAATYAGFAHLVGERNFSRALEIHKELGRIYVAVSVVLVSTYLVFNRTFVIMWVGEEHYGGQALSALIGISVLISGQTGFLNYLFGATGRLASSSFLIVAEALVRFPLMCGLLMAFSVTGLPLAKMLTALAAGQVTLLLTIRRLRGNPREEHYIGKKAVAGYAVILALSLVLGRHELSQSWLTLSVMVLTFVFVVIIIVALHEPYFRILLQRGLNLVLQLRSYLKVHDWFALHRSKI